MIIIEIPGGYDAASWETHRQVCEVRLDLDENDDSGRVGPHYRTAPTCTTFFSLADADVSIWTIDERPVDSVVVYIKDFGPGPEEQYLHYQEDPNFTIVNVNDTLLRVYPTDAGVGYADWGAWLATLQLEVPEPQLGGVRTVETLLYAGGLQADGARSYVNVRPNLPTAGPDRTFYACRSAVIRRERLIGTASPGGRFEPELAVRNLPFPAGATDTIFHSDSIAYGEYTYIVEREGCRSDTAVIDIRPPAEQLAAVPHPNDTAFICAGSTYLWDPASFPTVFNGFHETTGNFDPLPLTQPGTYRAGVDYFWPENTIISGCNEWLSITLIASPDSALSRSVDTMLCAGEAVSVGGMTFDATGSYTFSVPGQGCDTTYTLDLTVTEPPTVSIDTTVCTGGSFEFLGNVFSASGSYTFSDPAAGACGTTYELDLLLLDAPTAVSLDTTICEGETITLFGTTYSQFGTYNVTVDQQGCPTEYELSLTERPPVQVSLDTTLCAGETLLYAGTFFSSAGVYNVNNTIGQGCDSIFAITLSYLPAVITVLDTAILEGESLAVADTVLTSAGTYEFTYPLPDGCDSLFRVVLDIISSTAGPAGRAAAAYRVTNPIRSLRDFRVFDAAGTEVAVRELEIFGIGGRRVGAWPGLTDLPDLPLAAGVYVYRFADSRGQRVIGRVVVLAR